MSSEDNNLILQFHLFQNNSVRLTMEILSHNASKLLKFITNFRALWKISFTLLEQFHYWPQK